MPRKVLTAAAPEPQQDTAIQVEVTLPVRQRGGEAGKTPKDQARSTSARQRIPRITRLMALAIKFQDMVDQGEVRDYADIARLGYVTRARVTQVMNLMRLAPDLQECLLLSTSEQGGAPTEREIRRIVAEVFWVNQRSLWGGNSISSNPRSERPFS